MSMKYKQWIRRCGVKILTEYDWMDRESSHVKVVK